MMLAIEIILLLLMYIRSQGDAFTPGFIAMFMFFVATLCILYNEDLWAVTYSKDTFFVVTVGFFCIFFADAIASKLYRFKIALKTDSYRKSSVLPQRIEISKKLTLFIGALMLFGLGEQIAELIRMGNSIGVDIALNLIGMVKESDLKFTFIGKLFYQFNNIFLTIYLFCLAYNVRIKNKKDINCLYIYPIIIGFINLLITGSRSILYRGVFTFVITMIISYKDSSDTKSSKSSKYLIKKIAVPMVCLTVGFYALRTITKASTASSSRAFMEYMTYYIGSPLYLLNKYMMNPTSVTSGSPYFGGQTFSGFYNTLYNFGILQQPVENLKFVYVGDLSNGYYVGGNEYSFFMRPYDDFGLFGMAVFTFLCFFVFSYIYYRFATKKNIHKSLNALLIYSYFFYIVPMAFYYPFTVQESKIMNLVYMLIMVFAFEKVTRKENEYH